MVTGVVGVVGPRWGKADFRPGEHGVNAALGTAACLLWGWVILDDLPTAPMLLGCAVILLGTPPRAC
jgi:drug/metabolite transporter (DMT)-like permease